MKKSLYGLALVLLLLGGAIIVYWYVVSVTETNETQTSGPAWMVRSYPQYGIAFSYPTSYEFMVEPPLAGEVTTLLETFVMYPATEYAAVRSGIVAGEWPPAIRVAVYKDPRSVQSELTGSAAHDLLAGFSIRDDISERTVQGIAGIEFLADGLYLSDNIIFAHEGFIFHISAEWVNEDDDQRRDMAQLVSTLQLSLPVLLEND